MVVMVMVLKLVDVNTILSKSEGGGDEHRITETGFGIDYNAEILRLDSGWQ